MLLRNRCFANCAIFRALLISTFNRPSISLTSPSNVDRTKAQQVGLSQADVANSVLTSLSGSFQTSPQFWLNWKNGVSYDIAVQEPQYRMDTLQDSANIPITGSAGAPPQILTNVASLRRGFEPSTVSHYNVHAGHRYLRFRRWHRPANAWRNRWIKCCSGPEASAARLPDCRPRPGPDHALFHQRPARRPAVCHRPGLPADRRQLPVVGRSIRHHCCIACGATGIVWFLFLTHTHISVPALTGSIMCMGVATANSILVVSFAREEMARGAECD